MKALSIRQPWAWLIANGYKPVENRPRKISYRGEILIHASQTFDQAGYDWVRNKFPRIPMPSPAGFDRGGIVVRTTITDCVTLHLSPFFFGPYGYVCNYPSPLRFRPFRGMLGLFEVPDA